MKLDHVVYFTQASPDAVVQQQANEGRYAVAGGRHEKWGTYNALLYAGNAYVEWLAVEEPRLATQVDHPLTRLLLYDLPAGDRWGTLCLSVEGIESFQEEVENKGFQTSGVLNAQRRTASGELKKWKMLFIDQPVSDELPYPFFIEWEEPEEVRLEKLRREGALPPGNETLEIQECIFHVQDPLKETGEWAVLLSQKVGDDHSIQLENVKLSFREHEEEKERLADVIIGQTDAYKQP
ncbi:VOC family protein [Sporosarcina sp. Te-1]|uniref:VOC family protein n=1 Tax=Sporosarcina sp. Te-1 TaxID=2818390 RepID=UPI001A9F137E|nr:VOC family protein [Sporosarcina sp. Te-1]QTD39649.1 VOC family protein [Sporosarcina sp. Te-1]